MQDVVFLEVLRGAKHFQVAKERLDITNDSAFLGIGLDDQIKPAALEIEFAVSESQIVEFGHIEPEKAHSEVEGRAVGERVQSHLQIEFRLVHDNSRGLDSGH